VIKFDPEQKGTLLGKGGATINRIQQESQGAVLELGKGDDSSLKISGPTQAVMRAREALAALLHLDAKSVKVIDVPAETIDAVVGKGGENVRRLEKTHGVSIDSNRSGGRTEPCKMKLRGSVEGVKAALEELGALIERERRIEEALEVESQHIGMLLGKGGATINAIQRDTGAVLDIQKRANEGSSTQTVTIKGNKSTVRKAAAALEAVLQYKAETHEVLTIDPRMMPLLIGKGGEEINRIRTATGAAIDAERDSDKPQLKIRGSADAAAQAKQAILDSIELNKITTESVVLPWHAIDVLLGPNAGACKARV
jgi:polyribonucleotide nucleotidyltransferase